MNGDRGAASMPATVAVQPVLTPHDEPAETLYTLAQERKVRVITPTLGSAIEPARVEVPSPWWREVGAAHERRDARIADARKPSPLV